MNERPDLERLADEAIDELVASGSLARYSGSLPPRARDRLRQLKVRLDDEAVFEDLFTERMIALTRNEYVEEVSDEDLDAKVITASHVRPVMVDIYSDYCRPCNHVLPIVYQLAEKYRHDVLVVKINVTRNVRFRERFLGPVQMTPAFLFFRNGEPVAASGRFARLLGQMAFVASTRAALERRIRRVIGLSPRAKR